jgi:hypothetical protein
MEYGTRIAFSTLRRARLHLPVAAMALICAGTAFPAYADVTQSVLWSFTRGSDGGHPDGMLLADKRGALYLPEQSVQQHGARQLQQRHCDVRLTRRLHPPRQQPGAVNGRLS